MKEETQSLSAYRTCRRIQDLYTHTGPSSALSPVAGERMVRASEYSARIMI